MSTNTTGRRVKDDDVLELIHSVMHRYRARQYRFLRDGPQDITHMEGKVLFFFERHPGGTQSDLAQHSGRDKAQLARLIKGLRDKGLLEAETDEADRRQVRLQVSEAGLAVQRELKRQARQVSVQALAGLNAAEQAQLAELLRRVQANLGEE
ncbi:MarR family transcriptional regulator [Mitsuaria sp. GD03876]|uniref:MarR family winged helix-turn-helix transcriptional regulator n=1 Tax=Mitsuaria sp. GD03876 TaxID=2975399 RepID=UPI0024497477|nr:MarR family transcriptional regulator [Mitsuaria sp. GD03876]MDH0866720.1 MarR family transcriptional regulator [Mitsuaria sp. GD03876]